MEPIISLGRVEITRRKVDGKHTNNLGHPTDLPNASKFDVSIDGKCILECPSLSPTCFIVFAVHPVHRRDLLVVILWWETCFVKPMAIQYLWAFAAEMMVWPYK